MLITMTSDSSRALSTRLKWPLCSAPIVGTNPMRAPLFRADVTASRTSSMVDTRRTLVAMLGIGIYAGPHLVGVFRNRFSRCLRNVCVFLEKLWSEAVIQSEQIRQYQNLPIAMGTRADSNRRNRYRRGNPAGDVRGQKLSHDSNC